MTRKTFYPIDGPTIGCTFEVSRREMGVTTQGWGRRRNELAHRNIMGALEDAGYTTHLDVIRDSALVQTAPGLGGGVQVRFTFPPRAPQVGDSARLEGGPAHGETVAVPGGDVKVITQDGREHLYEPAGFDTATGHWVYHEVKQ